MKHINILLSLLFLFSSCFSGSSDEYRQNCFKYMTKACKVTGLIENTSNCLICDWHDFNQRSLHDSTLSLNQFLLTYQQSLDKDSLWNLVKLWRSSAQSDLNKMSNYPLSCKELHDFIRTFYYDIDDLINIVENPIANYDNFETILRLKQNHLLLQMTYYKSHYRSTFK